MTEQDAVERVAKAIEDIAEIEDDLDQTACGDIWLANPKECAAAAIAAYNAYLRERAQDSDVVEAGILNAISPERHHKVIAASLSLGEERARATIAGALDAMIGKESHDDR